MYIGECEGEPIETSNLIIDSNNVEYLGLNLYNLNPSYTYILKIVQNGTSSATTITLNYISMPPITPQGPFCWPPCPNPPDCNIVINGSFETTIGGTLGNLNAAIHRSFGWYGNKLNLLTYTADYFNSNSTNSQFQVPSSSINNPAAKSLGNGTTAYGGLVTLWTSLNSLQPGQFRESMTGTLNQPLEAGKTYRVTYYVNLSQRPGYNFACVAPGLHFTNRHNRSLKPIDINNMTADISDNEVLASTGNWVEVSGNYTADGTETHFVIANFESDNNSVAPANIGNYTVSYFFVDEVSITDNNKCCANTPTLNGGDIEDLQNLLTSKNYTTEFLPSSTSSGNKFFTVIRDLNINLNGVINFDENIIFENCRIFMGLNAKINITKEVRFEGNAERFIKSCDSSKFWDGIYVNGGAKGSLRILKTPGGTGENAAFENAMNGIVTTGNPYVSLNYINFDRNNLAVKIKTNNNYNAGIIIKNCDFRCSTPLVNSSNNQYYPSRSIQAINFILQKEYFSTLLFLTNNNFDGSGGQVYLENSITKIEDCRFVGFNNL